MDHDNIKVTFVIPSGCGDTEQNTSEEMQQAYEACKQNGIDSQWYPEDDCVNLKLQKTDFFVFQEFKGKVFEKIRTTKSVRIVGPWCLLTCLTEGREIPNFPWPIYSVAMVGCTVAFSSLSKQEKKDLQEKVEFMGGYVSAGLMGSCTHLITNSVKSEKYIKAAESGKRIMLSSWLDDVWEASLKANVHCTNERFNKHICPVFYNLTVCCTGLSNGQRNDLRQYITENGGTYKEQLHVHNTDIVVTESRTQSAKYKAAKKYNIKCVTMLWATDSIKNGYAMPDTLYQVQIGTSTPTKDSEDLPNFSMISNIANATEYPLKNALEFSETIDGTQISKIGTPVKPSSTLKRKNDSNEHNELVDEINLKEVKKAGPFLDGCGIYLVGFGTEQREKLCKILNFSGATRYDDLSSRVTHIVAGDLSSSEFKYLRSKNFTISHPIVSILWLLNSMAQRSPADEEKFIISREQVLNEPGSPLSKKSLHLLHTVTCAVEEKEGDISAASSLHAADANSIQQCLHNTSSQEDTLAKLLQNDTKFKSKQDNPEPHEPYTKQDDTSLEDHQNIRAKPQQQITETDASLSSAIDDDSNQPPDPIFQDLKFVIVGFTPEERKQIRIAIESMAGTVVAKSYKGICDYAVVPAFSSTLKHVATNIVNDLWITECWQESLIRPILYFHQPISIKEDVKPLQNCVVTISSYTNYERNFLKNLISQLGGVCQELLSRIDSKTGLLACTHLVSPEAIGRKYAAAIKWGLPVLNKDWLLECAQSSKYPLETPFLIGDAKPSLRSVQNPSKDDYSINKIQTLNTDASSHQQSSTLTTDASLHEQISIKVTDAETTESVERANLVKSHHVTELKNTPVQKKSSGSGDRTPLNRAWNSSGVTASQITPVQKIIAEARRHNLLGTPEQSLPFPSPWDHVDTPETPLGAFIRANPSPNLRKDMVRFLNTFPDYKPRRDSTPLSELKRQLWNKICPPKDGNIPSQPNFDTTDEDEVLESRENVENVSTPPNKKSNIPESVVTNQLKQLQEMLTASGGNRSERKSKTYIPVPATELKDSQPNTVGWDDDIEDNRIQAPIKPVFMFSGVGHEKRVEMIDQLESLGATVTHSVNFDINSTHLISSTLSRNEKILGSMSAGKWILHESYVNQCALEGKFVDEEFFEFGNPKSSDNIHMQNDKENDRSAAAHFWRKEVSRRGYGAFHDMRLIVVAQKREPLIRVLQAGGGMVIDEIPPFTKPVHATHCLLDLKAVGNIDDYIPLAQQGIFCVNTLYVSHFLSRTEGDIQDFIIPYLLEYYES